MHLCFILLILIDGKIDSRLKKLQEWAEVRLDERHWLHRSTSSSAQSMMRLFTEKDKLVRASFDPDRFLFSTTKTYCFWKNREDASNSLAKLNKSKHLVHVVSWCCCWLNDHIFTTSNESLTVSNINTLTIQPILPLSKPFFFVFVCHVHGIRVERMSQPMTMFVIHILNETMILMHMGNVGLVFVHIVNTRI